MLAPTAGQPVSLDISYPPEEEEVVVVRLPNLWIGLVLVVLVEVVVILRRRGGVTFGRSVDQALVLHHLLLQPAPAAIATTVPH